MLKPLSQLVVFCSLSRLHTAISSYHRFNLTITSSSMIFIQLLRIEANLPLSSLFQSSNGTPVANCSSGKSKTGFDEISGSVLLVLRAVTQQPLGFWTDRDWVGEGSQHLVETEVVIVGGDEKCGVYPSSTKRAIIGATYLKKNFDNSATFSFYSSF